jgi:regulator of protease activity HflC (stomatin/prohibitin superfamily)
MKSFIAVGLVVPDLYCLLGNSLFVVKETERAVMLQFGELVNADIAARVACERCPG